MKKILLTFAALFSALFVLSICVSATQLQLVSPTEDEIMPGRDFYVVGIFDRNLSASENPLNISIEVISSDGEVLRRISSNVAPNGTTSANYFLSDYEFAKIINDNKGVHINSFTPPDMIYNGFDRDSIRDAYNKIVVKDNYFAAIIYSGGTKETNLKYEDSNGETLKDLTTGIYTINVSAVNFDGELVCSTQRQIEFADTKERFIANGDFSEFASENNLIQPKSIAGFWKPERFLNEKTNNFTYVDNVRWILNSDCEFKNAKKVGILINKLEKDDDEIKTMLGSAFAEDSQADITHYYYDIGEKSVDFYVMGEKHTKDGVILKSNENVFVKLLRAEHTNPSDDTIYVDFDLDDGVILSEKTNPTFYGIYSPINPTSSAYSGTYNIKNSVSRLKAVLTDSNGNVICENIIIPGLKRTDDAVSLYEFSFTLPISYENIELGNAVLKVYACDSDGNSLAESDAITAKISDKGNFIGEYDENYWGKSYCDTVNMFGSTPSTEMLTPDEYISRGNFAAMINNIFGFSYNEKFDFSDVDQSDVFYNDCMTANAAGYMTGDENSHMNVDDLIKREEAVIMLSRLLNAENAKKQIEFYDSDQISFWAQDAVDLMVSNGIVTGFNGYLHPRENITVAEAAALIIKTIKRIHTNIDPIDGKTEFELPEDEFISSDFVADVNFETIQTFFYDNTSSLNSVIKYIQTNCNNGIYVKKVGNGLELRDYFMGDFVTLSPKALELIETFASKFELFSIKYNPSGDNVIYFVLGKNENGKEIGLTYAENESILGKTLLALENSWYCFVQK